MAEAGKFQEGGPTLPRFPQEGGCLCGAVRYRLMAAPLAVYNCHCRDCQRATGSLHGMSMPVRVEDFVRLSGETSVYEKPADSGRVVRMLHCTCCGTNVWNEPEAPGLVIVKPGTLDDFSWAQPVGNIWTASASPRAQIDSGLINFAGQPPSREVFYEAWTRHLEEN